MGKHLKVLQLGSSSGLYGAERWILSLVKYFDTENVKSYVGAVVDNGGSEAPLSQEAAKLGVESVTFHAAGRFSLSVLQDLRQYIRMNDIDIVHSHGYKTDFLALVATCGLSCKTVTTPHGWTEKPDFKLSLYEKLDRFMFPFFDKVVPLSDGLMQSISTGWASRANSVMIRNGVDIGEIEALEQTSSEIEVLKRDGYTVVGYIGRLVAGKAIDVLIASISRLPEAKIKLLVIGEGEEDSALEALVESLGLSEKIQFLGFRPDRLAFLKGFDIFVLPSRSEGIPRCVMEAMAAEVPVIASDIPGCRTLINGTSTGLLFKMDDEEALASRIQELLENKPLRSQLAKQAKCYLKEHYSSERMALEYETLFKAMSEIA